MENLQKVIKDLEFENENLVQKIKDEIGLIDGIQKDIREKTADNEKLDEEIEKANVETKSLHEQFKQNKEIADSLKNATSLQQRHCSDLKTTLKLKIGETELQREKNERDLDIYASRWQRFEAEYEKHPVAKEIRKLKLDAANLDTEAKKLEVKKTDLERMVAMLQESQAKKKEKAEAIKSIIKLAELKLSTESLKKQIPNFMQEGNAVKFQLDVCQREFEQLKKENEEKKKVANQPLVASQPSWVTNKQLPRISFPQAVPSNSPVPSNSSYNAAPNLRNPTIPVPRLTAPRLPLNQVRLPKLLQVPKMPQLPKFPQFKANINKQANIDASPAPRMTFQPPVPPQPMPVASGNEIKDIPMEGEYDVPLDQPTKEFFNEESNMEVDGKDSSAPPPSYSFSPASHAERLKKLKQSPADAYIKQSRPMFTAGGDNSNSSPAMTTPNNGFATSFSNQHQFMGYLVKSGASNTPQPPKDDTPKMPVPVEPPSPVCTSVTNPTVISGPNIPASRFPSSTADASCGLPNNAVPYQQNFDSRPELKSNFGNTNSQVNSSIDFNSSTNQSNTFHPESSPATEFNFDMPSADFSPDVNNFNFGTGFSSADKNDGNFNFGITSPATPAANPTADFNSFQMSTSTDSAFNFGTGSNNDSSPAGLFNMNTANTPGGNNDSLNFSFGGNMSGSDERTSNSFSFTF